MPSRTALRALWIIGAILLAGGIALTWWRWAHPAVSGWFAYAPLSSPHVTLTATPDWVQITGYICSVLGALAIGTSIGTRLHRE